MNIHVALEKNGYDVTLERGALARAGEIFDLDRKVMLITDSGVPEIYAKTIERQCAKPCVLRLEQGEKSKNLDSFESICAEMLKNGFTRKDCVVAVGGGVVGDLAGFVAASFMRGVDFYNVPTTLLSQVDSSVGGKTGVDFCGIKNIIGAFYQPKGVIIDADVLATLPREQFACGAAEAVKMAAVFDADLLLRIEKDGVRARTEEVIARCIELKADVVAKDEKEAGLRRALNFGHTLGHGIESVTGMLHGQCVALGMLPMTAQPLRERLSAILAREELPVACSADAAAVVEAAMHDKKSQGDFITTVRVTEAGSFSFESADREKLLADYGQVFGVQL